MKRLALVALPTGYSFGMPTPLLFLAAWVKKYCPGWTVRIVDSKWEEPERVLLDRKAHWDAVGIGAMTSQYEAATNLATMLHIGGVFPVILGGVHITSCPESRRDCFDICVLGEGERGLVSIAQGSDLPGTFIGNEPINLKDYPDLDYSLLNWQYYLPRTIRGWQGTVREAMMLTARGCPYKCTFCATSAFWGSYRAHDPDWVVRQMCGLTELGVDHIQIFDDLFPANKARLRRIAELFEVEGLRRKIKEMGCQVRANVVDDETCELLASMNVKVLGFGFESGSQKVIRSLKLSGASVEDNREAVKTCVRWKMRAIGSYMMGSPGEYWWDMWKTVFEIARLTWLGASDIWMCVSTPYPGTKFWRLLEERSGAPDNPKEFDWRKINLASKWPGEIWLSEVPRWQFIITWVAAHVALLPMKLRKLYNLCLAQLKLTLMKK